MSLVRKSMIALAAALVTGGFYTASFAGNTISMPTNAPIPSVPSVVFCLPSLLVGLPSCYVIS